MIIYFLFFVSFQPNWSIAQKGDCDDNKNGCCSGTIWNETLGKCTGCMPGYFGQYCNKTCKYPRYGMRCMGKCDCEQDRCNFVTGCPNYESSTILELSSFIPEEGKPLFNNGKEQRKSVLVPIISVLGSVLIAVGILYAIIHELEKRKVSGPPDSLSTQTKHYEQIDEIAIHI